MLQQLINRFGTTVYVQIWSDRIRLVDLHTGKVFEDEPVLIIDKSKTGAASVVGMGRAARSRADLNCEAATPFSHPRVLLSDFAAGEKLLKLAIESLLPKRVFRPAPFVILHPMEKTEGGLTMIEDRAFRELSLCAGARAVMIYEGPVIKPEGFSLDKLKATYAERLT